MKIHPKSCIYCKHSSFDWAERAQIRLTGKSLPCECYKWDGNELQANFNEIDDDYDETTDYIFENCGQFEPCPPVPST